MTVPGKRSVTLRISFIATALFCPPGQARILPEQVGMGEVQLKVPPGGVDDKTILVLFPEHIVFE